MLRCANSSILGGITFAGKSVVAETYVCIILTSFCWTIHLHVLLLNQTSGCRAAEPYIRTSCCWTTCTPCCWTIHLDVPLKNQTAGFLDAELSHISHLDILLQNHTLERSVSELYTLTPCHWTIYLNVLLLNRISISRTSCSWTIRPDGLLLNHMPECSITEPCIVIMNRTSGRPVTEPYTWMSCY